MKYSSKRPGTRRRDENRKTAATVFFALSALLLAAFLLPATVAAATTIEIGDGSAEPNGTAVVPLMIKDVTNAGSVEVNLTFDETVVNVTGTDTSSDFDLPPQNPPTQRGPGWVVINAGQISTGLDGDVKICDVTLQAKGVAGDTSPLELTDVKLQDIGGTDILPVFLSDGDFKILEAGTPYTTGWDPADGATNVPTDTEIVVHVKDDGKGVDQSTIVMKVNGQVVTPTITGTTADYTLTYKPTTDFGYGQVVWVTVDAADLNTPPNAMPQDKYSFTTSAKPPAPVAVPGLNGMGLAVVISALTVVLASSVSRNAAKRRKKN